MDLPELKHQNEKRRKHATNLSIRMKQYIYVKLCFIFGGFNIHHEKWINFFYEKGHEIHIISRSKDTAIKNQNKEKITWHYLSWFFPREWKILNIISAIFWIIQIRGIIRKIKPDLINSHYITINGYLGALSGFHPFVLTAWGSDILIAPKQNVIDCFLTKYALKKADLITCDSETLTNKIHDNGAEENKIKKIYHGTDTEKFSPQPRDPVLMKNLNINDNFKIVISTRVLGPVYNIEMLIKSIPLILKQHSNTIFIIVGDGPQSHYLKNIVESLGISSSIRFTGYIPNYDIPKYLALSDIYVSTSLSDSTSLCLQEAMACELAPVVTDISANKEWIENGDNGFLIPVNDVQKLAEKIVDLINNDQIREKMGRRNREIVVKNGVYRKEMQKMELLYQNLVQKYT